MSTTLSLTNCVFGWILMSMALVGFFYTKKRIGQNWPSWLLLAAGWMLFGLAQTLLLAGALVTLPAIIALWLSSYIFIMASILLLFLKVVRLKSDSK
jgi:hypothetical protein